MSYESIRTPLINNITRMHNALTKDIADLNLNLAQHTFIMSKLALFHSAHNALHEAYENEIETLDIKYDELECNYENEMSLGNSLQEQLNEAIAEKETTSLSQDFDPMEVWQDLNKIESWLKTYKNTDAIAKLQDLIRKYTK